MKIKNTGWVIGILAGLALFTLGGVLIFRSEPGSSQSPGAVSALRQKDSEVAGQQKEKALPENRKITLNTEGQQSGLRLQQTGSDQSDETSRMREGVSAMGSEGAKKNMEDLLALELAQKEKRSEEARRLQIQQRHKKQEVSRQYHQVARIRTNIARLRNELSQYEEDVQPRELQLQQMGRLFGQIDRVRDELATQQKQILSSDEPTSSQLALAHSLDRDLNQLNQIQSNAKQQLTKHSRTRPRSMPGRDNPGTSSTRDDS